MTTVNIAVPEYKRLDELKPRTFFTYADNTLYGKTIFMTIQSITVNGIDHNCVCIHPGTSKDIPGKTYRAFPDSKVIEMSRVDIHD